MSATPLLLLLSLLLPHHSKEARLLFLNEREKHKERIYVMLTTAFFFNLIKGNKKKE